MIGRDNAKGSAMDQMPTITDEQHVVKTTRYSWDCPGCGAPWREIAYAPQSYEDSLCPPCISDREQRELEAHLAPLEGGEVERVELVRDPTYRIDVPSMREIASLRLIDRDGRVWIVLAKGVLCVCQEQVQGEGESCTPGVHKGELNV